MSTYTACVACSVRGKGLEDYLQRLDNTVDQEIFAIKIFNQLLRRQKLNA